MSNSHVFGTFKLILVCSAAALAGCNSSGNTTNGGMAGGGGGAGGNPGGGTGATGTAVSFVDVTNKAVARKYAQDIQVNLSNPTNPTTRYLVGDRNTSGGQELVIRTGSNAAGEAVEAQYGLANNANLETGDPLKGGAGLANSESNFAVTGGGTRNTFNSLTAQRQSDSLGVVDYDYARAGVSIFVDTPNNEFYETAFAGSKNGAAPTTGLAGRATYRGSAGARLIAPSSVSGLSGDLQMDVNIGTGANTVSGSVSNIQITATDGTTSSAPFTLEMQQGTINADGTYSGALALQDNANQNANLGDFTTPVQPGLAARAEYNGAFYGPNGEETAGLLDATGRADLGSGTERVDLIGSFVGKKQ